MVLVALLAILLILLTLMKLPEQYINFKDTVIWQLTYTEMPDDKDFNSNQIDVNIQYIEDNAFSVSYRDTFADVDGNSKSIYRFGIIDGATMYHIMQEADKIDMIALVDRHRLDYGIRTLMGQQSIISQCTMVRQMRLVQK